MTALLATLSSSKIAALVAVGVLVLFMALLVSSFIRTRRTIAATVMAAEGQPPPTTPKEPPAPRKPPPAVTRREFFRRSLVGSLLVFGAEFGGASLAFLWPNLKGGFGSVIAAGEPPGPKQPTPTTQPPLSTGPRPPPAGGARFPHPLPFHHRVRGGPALRAAGPPGPPAEAGHPAGHAPGPHRRRPRETPSGETAGMGAGGDRVPRDLDPRRVA